MGFFPILTTYENKRFPIEQMFVFERKWGKIPTLTPFLA